MQPLRQTSRHDYRAELFELIRTRSFGRGKIMLASGRESDFYIDLRPTTLHPAGATCVGELICDALEGIERRFRRRAGNGRGADRHRGRDREPPARRQASARSSCARSRRITARRSWSKACRRAKRCAAGTSWWSRTSPPPAARRCRPSQALREEGANIVLVLTIVDRLEGAKENFAAEKLAFRALYTADEFLRPEFYERFAASSRGAELRFSRPH